MADKHYLIEVTMPSGEKLETVKVDRDAFTISRSSDVGAAIGDIVGKLIEKRLKA